MSCSNRMSHPARRRGSLLIEALLSIVILSTALTFMIQAMTSSLQAMHYGAGYTTALILLDNQMCDLLRKRTVASAFSETKDLTESAVTYHYTLQSGSWDAATDQGINQVDAKIAWRSGKKDNTISLSTLLLTAPQ